MDFDPSSLFLRFDAVSKRLEKAVAKSAKKQKVQLIAVSKKHPAESVAALATYWKERAVSDMGDIVFGENYVEEALEKQIAVASALDCQGIQWNFIGHLQSRKAKLLAGKFSLIHTVDSIKLANQLQKATVALEENEKSVLPQPVLLQVNIGREVQKGGVMPEGLESLAQSVLSMPELTVKGLMCMPPYDSNAEFSRQYFQKLRHLRDNLENSLQYPFPELSMGMSHDFEVAIEEGATMVRVGTDIFGARA